MVGGWSRVIFGVSSSPQTTVILCSVSSQAAFHPGHMLCTKPQQAPDNDALFNSSLLLLIISLGRLQNRGPQVAALHQFGQLLSLN